MSADVSGPRPSAPRVVLVFRTDGPDFPTPTLAASARLVQFPPVGTPAQAVQDGAVSCPWPPAPAPHATSPSVWVVDMGALHAIFEADGHNPWCTDTLAAPSPVARHAWMHALHRHACAVALVTDPAAALHRPCRAREQLLSQGVPHAVLHATAVDWPQAIERWVKSLGQIRQIPSEAARREGESRVPVAPWRHLCGRCGEPSCERALFSGFVPKDG